MGIPEAKTSAREQILRTRSTRPVGHGPALARRLRSLPEIASSSAIAAYASTADEPDTWPFIHGWTGDLWLPVVVGDALHWGRCTDVNALKANTWGLLEPEDETAVLPDDVTVMVIPALAVDLSGNRLGRGAGYYDRALTALSHSRHMTLVAAVHDDEVLPSVPHEPFDVPVDVIVTPARVIRAAQASRRSNNT
jgi:5-formyltetrahydrofolate cyclo-ligase